MPSYLAQRRSRLPLAVFVLLLILCLALLGVACFCASGHHAQSPDRLGAALAAPAILEIWSLVVVLIIGTAIAASANVPGRGRASPAELQRFLF